MLYAAMRFVVAPLARLVYRPVVEGRENVPKHGAVIIASNHLSFIDSVVIPICAPRPVVFIAKKEYWEGTGVRGALVRGWFNTIGSIPVERGTFGAAQESLDAALAVLKDGQAFGIYPEGTRSRDGRLYRGKTGVGWLALTAQVPVVPCAVIGTEKLQPVGSRFPRLARFTSRDGRLYRGKTGVGWLALTAQVPVVPCAVIGTEKLQPVGSRFPRLARFTIRFGEPLRFPPPSTGTTAAQARRAATDQVMAAIAAMSPQELAGVYNEAPHAP